MFCNKCGNKVELNQQYCNKCGNRLSYNIQNKELNEDNFEYYDSNNFDSRKSIRIPIIILVIAIILISVMILCFFKLNNNNYYFNNEIGKVQESKPDTIEQSQQTTKVTGKYETDIVTNNTYEKVSLENFEDVKKLIRKDSVDQKKSNYPKEILKIEDDIIGKYSITAVNLKEMDTQFAKELEDVINEIYTYFPTTKGYLTNLTLTNLDTSQAKVIALFMPIFPFASSNTETTLPWGIKTQIQLNAKYFLNPDSMTAAINASSKAGHFPKNATKYSSVAHELGHYLSFIALLKQENIDSIMLLDEQNQEKFFNMIEDWGEGTFSKKILNEAYTSYVKDNGDIDFDEWRGQISKYALAKNESGNYIYDETVAEAFHDFYLNKQNANNVSKYIVRVLKKYIEN